MIAQIDRGVAAVWDRSDAEYVLKSIIGSSKYDETFRLLERRFNDQTAFDDRVNQHLEPLQVTYKEDLVVNDGLTRIAQLLTGESTTSFTHFASGTGSTSEGSADTTLDTELARVEILPNARFVTGTTAKFTGFFGHSTPSGVVSEGGVFDAATDGTMLFRTVYPATITHTQDETIFTLQQTIESTAST